MFLQSQRSSFNGVQKLRGVFGFDIQPEIYKLTKICAPCKLFLEKLEAIEKKKKNMLGNLHAVMQKAELHVKRCAQVSPVKGVSTHIGQKKKTKLAFESPQKENRPVPARMEVRAPTKSVQNLYHPILPKPPPKERIQTTTVPLDYVRISTNENNNISQITVPINSQLGKICHNFCHNCQK